MRNGFAPATKATMIATKARSRHMPVTGGRSANGVSTSFRVVLLLILLLDFLSGELLSIGLLSLIVCSSHTRSLISRCRKFSAVLHSCCYWKCDLRWLCRTMCAVRHVGSFGSRTLGRPPVLQLRRDLGVALHLGLWPRRGRSVCPNGAPSVGCSTASTLKRSGLDPTGSPRGKGGPGGGAVRTITQGPTGRAQTPCHIRD
jgi:hypothetical protein